MPCQHALACAKAPCAGARIPIPNTKSVAETSHPLVHPPTSASAPLPRAGHPPTNTKPRPPTHPVHVDLQVRGLVPNGLQVVPHSPAQAQGQDGEHEERAVSAVVGQWHPGGWPPCYATVALAVRYTGCHATACANNGQLKHGIRMQ